MNGEQTMSHKRLISTGKGEQERANSLSQIPTCFLKFGYVFGGRDQKEVTCKYVELCSRIFIKYG